MQGRFFSVPVRHGLGELPETALQERGELGVSPAFGLPPRGDAFIPGPTGVPSSDTNLSENQSVWQSIPFSVGLEPLKLQDFLLRKFLLIQNIDPVGTLYFGFGWIPTSNNALVLPPGTGYEPYRYPTNEIYVLSSVVGPTLGFLIYGT